MPMRLQASTNQVACCQPAIRGAPGRGLQHLNIAGCPAVQAWVAEQIESLAGAPGLVAGYAQDPDSLPWRTDSTNDGDPESG